jgi:hypothetical protein
MYADTAIFLIGHILSSSFTIQYFHVQYELLDRFLLIILLKLKINTVILYFKRGGFTWLREI